MPEEVLLESAVARVEVYRHQALVTRRTRWPVAGRSGRLQCALVGLPLALLDDSLRIELPAGCGARVVDLHLGWRLGPRDQKLRTLAGERLADLTRARLDVEVAHQREVDRARWLASLDPEVPEADQMPETLAYQARNQLGAWLDLAAWVRAEVIASGRRMREIERQRRELLDRLAEARDEIERESRAELEALAVCRKVARVQLELPAPVDELEFELSYLVPGACWVPEYELRVSSGRDEAELVLRAMVAQRTGEDWEKAELAFSTADLRRSTALPELASWRIGKRQPQRASGWRSLPEGLAELFESWDRARGSLPAAPRPSAPDLPETPRLVEFQEPVSRPRPEPVLQIAEEAEEAEEEITGEYDDEQVEMSKMADMAPPAPPASAPSASLAIRPRAKAEGRASRAKSKKADARRQRAERRSMEPAGEEFAIPAEEEAEADEEYALAGLGASPQALGYQDLRMRDPSWPASAANW